MKTIYLVTIWTHKSENPLHEFELPVIVCASFTIAEQYLKENYNMLFQKAYSACTMYVSKDPDATINTGYITAIKFKQ